MKVSRRTQSGTDKRGSNADRRARKNWMLDTFGDGTFVACRHCATTLTYDTVQADRIIPGGTYRRANVQPSCATCNRQRSDDLLWLSPLALAFAALSAPSSVLVPVCNHRTVMVSA